MAYVLGMQDVLHKYNGRTVLDVPEFNIARGSIIGLAGPNGSGKSTMLRILSCVEKCSAGTVLFENKAAVPFAKRSRHHLTYLPQEPYLLKRSVFDNIAYGLRIRGRQDNVRSLVFNVLELVGLSSDFAGRQWYELSGGECQRVALASRLVFKPSCLMLDEPTASVDMESASIIRRVILRARDEWGTTLVVTSHHQSWLNDLCEKIVYLYNGRLLEHSYKNVLLGPWKKFGKDLMAMENADGQFIVAGKPPGTETCAVIPANAMRITSDKSAKLEQKLTCLVSGIFSTKNNANFQMYLAWGDHHFVVDVSEADLRSKGILPNQQATLFYDTADVVWLN